tara:strand:+ start:50 stop:1003 length:954 start_codon:yes stop_codon:yes gene_type:complete
MMNKVLVTGAAGQLGSELILSLQQKLGADNVIATDYQSIKTTEVISNPVEQLDVRDSQAVTEVINDYHVDTVFHLAALLSVVAEQKPKQAWDINMNGLLNVLEAARTGHCAVFFPSSIGAFGPSTPRFDTPQDTIQRPNTLYGITKVSGELLCDYYQQQFGVDARGLRFPGLISYKTLPGGGTTDYAVEIFYAALQQQSYECFLSADTQLDMMYMPDAVNAAIMLMETDPKLLIHHNAFNVTAMSITPAQLAAEIQRHIPTFEMNYRVDPVRQAIADTWPKHMDDSCAHAEWGWQAEFGLSDMVSDMLKKLSKKLSC